MTLIWKGDIAQKDIKMAIAEGSYITMENILTEAQRLCPRDTGTLRRSGTLKIDTDINAQEAYAQAQAGGTVSDSEDKLSANTKVIFDSFNTPYAHYQHELTSAVNYTEDGTSYKYLEKGWNAKIKGLDKNIKKVAQSRGLI